jgi:hypothetical protein
MNEAKPDAMNHLPAFRQYQPALTMDQIRECAPSVFAEAPHASRSKNYTFIPTSVIVEKMLEAGFAAYSATQSRSRIPGKSDFTKHMIRFRALGGKQEIIVGDVLPEIVVINAHDGTSSHQVSAGFHRLTCLNGMMVSEGTMDSIRVHHKGDIAGQVIDASLNIVNNMGRAVESIELWNSMRLTQREQLAFAQVAHTLRFADADGVVTTPVTPAQLLAPRRYADNGDSVWLTMNRIQENVIRGGISARAPRRAGERRGRMVTTRTVTGIDQDSRLNRALWALTEKMAEIKTADAADLVAA